MRTGNAPAVMGILRRTALNMVRTIQRKRESDFAFALAREPNPGGATRRGKCHGNHRRHAPK